MPIPTDRIKQALNEIGLEHTQVLVDTRLTPGSVRLRILATCYPDRAVPIQDEEPVNTLPLPAEGRVLVEHDKGRINVGTDRDPPSPDDLTIIPGIGKATQAKLAAAGLDSFAALAAATDEDLLKFVTRSTIYNVRAWTSSNPH